MSTFLLIVAFVFAFVPGTFQPFDGGVQERTVVADRIADGLTEGTLLDPSDPEPYVLDRGCVAAFFDGTEADAGCRFDNSEGLRERLGVSTYRDSTTYRHRVNVRLRGDPNDDRTVSRLCLDADSGDVVEEGNGCDSRAFEIGPDPPNETGSVVVARRVVSIDGRDATLTVRVW